MPEKVLVIDDEVDLCLLLKAFFTRKNFQVAIAYTLNEGLKQMESNVPDLLFLDNNLPDGLGWDYASQINEKYPHIKLNLISAYHPNLPNIKITPQIRVWEKPISLKDLEVYLEAK